MSATINIIGEIWQPGTGVCAYTYSLSAYDVDNMRNESGIINRVDINNWLRKNTGDFSHVIDFEADLFGNCYAWWNDNSVSIFSECMANYA